VKIDEKFLTQDMIRKIKPASKIGQGPDFSETLAKTNSKDRSDAAPASSVGRPSEVLDASPVGRILAVAAAGRTQAADQLDQALGTLDKYAKALADPSKTLKELAPLVKDLEETAARLDQLGRELPEGHDLRATIDQTAVLALVEAAKFNRGDYT
jgi:ABC-type transporter Mla subunit MlaD